MTSRAFDFRLGDDRCWAQGHSTGNVTLCLNVNGYKAHLQLTMTAAEARAAAVAIEAAATHAESTLPSGLGEGEAAA